MARYCFLSLGIVLVAAACHRSARIPQTSSQAEQLRWLDHVDVQTDFRVHVEQQHDTRFISVYALSFVGEFGLADTPETQELTRKHGSLHLEGTTDIITSSEHARLLRKASDYAEQYNSLLLAYLREHPNT
jgi:hypothetical protein